MKSGQDLLHYRLVEQIGEGGMGVVWKGVDTSLDREVAIKVLPEAVAHDEERLGRFEREAKLLATLNHPNIASVFGLHEAEGQRFIAMELVSGSDLSELMARGPVPVDEALGIARGVARALEAAHGAGVIHRDLKPANIRIDEQGEVKVLDFGLAKAFDAGSAGGSGSLSMSPTMTAHNTAAGLILGTAGYMSPEQARGKPVDRRADIWAFGVVLFEMLSGARLFDGETVSDVLAEVLKAEFDWSALPSETPAPARRMLRRCLTRNPRDRLHDIADARLELDEDEEEFAPPAAGPAEASPPWRRYLIGAVVGAALAGLALNIGQSSDSPAPQAAQPVHFQFDTGLIDLVGGAPAFAVSPDGSKIAYAAVTGTHSTIFLRPLDAFEGRPIPGTEGGHAPFFSPDGASIGFFKDGKVSVLSLAGGNPKVIATIPHAAGGGAWGEDGTIIFSTAFAAGTGAGLYRVAAGGGDTETLTVPSVEDAERNHLWPQFLPDGQHVLFGISRSGRSQAAILDLESGSWRPLAGIDGRAIYLPSGHLLFGDSDVLLAQAFDLESLELTGQPFALLDGLPTQFQVSGGGAQASSNGVFVHLGAKRSLQRLVWIDRDGVISPLPIEPGLFHWPHLSPDGMRLTTTSFGAGYVEVMNTDGGGRVHLDNAVYAIWMADNRTLLSSGLHETSHQVNRRSADASGDPERLTSGEFNHIVTSVSPDERTVLFYQQHPDTGRDIWRLDLASGEMEPLIATLANERSAKFSPDGRWYAYTSNRSGRDEVYVRRYGSESDDLLVSRDGGREPRWGPEGHELYYRSGSQMLAVPIDLTEPSAGAPEVLFEGSFAVDPGGLNQMYDVSADGQRFLMIQNADDLGLLNVVVGFDPDGPQ